MATELARNSDLQLRLREKMSNIFLTLNAIAEKPATLDAMDEPTLREFIKNATTWLEVLHSVGGKALTLSKNEYRKRLEKSNIDEVPDKAWIIKIEEEFTPYKFDAEALERLTHSPELPDDDIEKLGRHVPEEIIAAHFEPGSAVSITKMADRYDGHPIGDELRKAFSRDSLGKKLVFKPRPAPKSKTLPHVRQNAA